MTRWNPEDHDELGMDELSTCGVCGIDCLGVDECVHCGTVLCSDCGNEYEDCCALCYDDVHDDGEGDEDDDDPIE